MELKIEGDVINSPKHYVGNDGLEVIRVVESFELGAHLAQAVQYILRHEKKNGLEDLKKAQWWLNRYISNKERHIDTNQVESPKDVVASNIGYTPQAADFPKEETFAAYKARLIADCVGKNLYTEWFESSIESANNAEKLNSVLTTHYFWVAMHIPQHLTHSIVKSAVSIYEWALYNTPAEYTTLDLCKYAINKHGRKVIDYVPNLIRNTPELQDFLKTLEK